MNAAKAGSAIPVKFSLGGYQGMNIFTAASPHTQTIGCQSGRGRAAAIDDRGRSSPGSLHPYVFVRTQP